MSWHIRPEAFTPAKTYAAPCLMILMILSGSKSLNPQEGTKLLTLLRRSVLSPLKGKGTGGSSRNDRVYPPYPTGLYPLVRKSGNVFLCPIPAKSSHLQGAGRKASRIPSSQRVEATQFVHSGVGRLFGFHLKFNCSMTAISLQPACQSFQVQYPQYPICTRLQQLRSPVCSGGTEVRCQCLKMRTAYCGYSYGNFHEGITRIS